MPAGISTRRVANKKNFVLILFFSFYFAYPFIACAQTPQFVNEKLAVNKPALYSDIFFVRNNKILMVDLGRLLLAPGNTDTLIAEVSNNVWDDTKSGIGVFNDLQNNFPPDLSFRPLGLVQNSQGYTYFTAAGGGAFNNMYLYKITDKGLVTNQKIDPVNSFDDLNAGGLGIDAMDNIYYASFSDVVVYDNQLKEIMRFSPGIYPRNVAVNRKNGDVYVIGGKGSDRGTKYALQKYKCDIQQKSCTLLQFNTAGLSDAQYQQWRFIDVDQFGNAYITIDNTATGDVGVFKVTKDGQKEWFLNSSSLSGSNAVCKSFIQPTGVAVNVVPASNGVTEEIFVADNCEGRDQQGSPFGARIIKFSKDVARPGAPALSKDSSYTDGSGKIKLTWNNVDTAKSAMCYNIQHSVNEDFSFNSNCVICGNVYCNNPDNPDNTTCMNSTCDWTFQNALPNKNYYYRVQAKDCATYLTSNWSNTVIDNVSKGLQSSGFSTINQNQTVAKGKTAGWCIKAEYCGDFSDTMDLSYILNPSQLSDGISPAMKFFTADAQCVKGSPIAGHPTIKGTDKQFYVEADTASSTSTNGGNAYKITVTGVGQTTGTTSSLGLNLWVDSLSMDSIKLTTPENGTSISSSPPRFSWSPSKIFAGYRGFICSTASCDASKADLQFNNGQALSDTFYQLPQTEWDKLQSKLYYWIICAGDDTSSFSCKVWSEPFTFTKGDTASPVISHVPITQALEGDPVLVKATITDNVKVSGAALFYRKKGDTAFTSVAMANTTNAWEGTIPGASVTTAGVQYYLSAYDGAGNTVYSPASSSTPPYYEIPVQQKEDTNLNLIVTPDTTQTVTYFGQKIAYDITVKNNKGTSINGVTIPISDNLQGSSNSNSSVKTYDNGSAKYETLLPQGKVNGSYSMEFGPAKLTGYSDSGKVTRGVAVNVPSAPVDIIKDITVKQAYKKLVVSAVINNNPLKAYLVYGSNQSVIKSLTYDIILLHEVDLLTFLVSKGLYAEEMTKVGTFYESVTTKNFVKGDNIFLGVIAINQDVPFLQWKLFDNVPIVINDIAEDFPGGSSCLSNDIGIQGICPTEVIVGNRNMTAGFTKEGRLATLFFPHVGMYDHVPYYTRCDGAGKRFLGAKYYQGSFAGIRIHGTNKITWLMDETSDTGQPIWSQTVNYVSDDRPYAQLRYDNNENDVNVDVMETSFVPVSPVTDMTGLPVANPESNMLVRHFKITNKGSAPQTIHFIYYGYFNVNTQIQRPTVANLGAEWLIPSPLPVVWGWYYENNKVSYTTENKTIVWVNGNNAVRIGAKIDGKLVEPEQVRIAEVKEDLSTSPLSSGAFHLAYLPFQQFTDSQKEGKKVNAFMEWEIPVDSTKDITIYIATGNESSTATMINNADFDTLKSITETAWSDFFQTVDTNLSKQGLKTIASTSSPDMLKRSIVNLTLLADQETGVFIASPNLQPQFYPVWPRDGVFQSLAWMALGFNEVAARFYQWLFTHHETEKDSGWFWRQAYGYDESKELTFVGFPFTSSGDYIATIEQDQMPTVLWGLWVYFKKNGKLPNGINNEDVKNVANYILNHVFVDNLLNPSLDIYENPLDGFGQSLYTNSAAVAGLMAASELLKVYDLNFSNKLKEKAKLIKTAITELLWDKNKSKFWTRLGYKLSTNPSEVQGGSVQDRHNDAMFVAWPFHVFDEKSDSEKKYITGHHDYLETVFNNPKENKRTWMPAYLTSIVCEIIGGTSPTKLDKLSMLFRNDEVNKKYIPDEFNFSENKSGASKPLGWVHALTILAILMETSTETEKIVPLISPVNGVSDSDFIIDVAANAIEKTEEVAAGIERTIQVATTQLMDNITVTVPAGTLQKTGSIATAECTVKPDALSKKSELQLKSGIYNIKSNVPFNQGAKAKLVWDYSMNDKVKPKDQDQLFTSEDLKFWKAIAQAPEQGTKKIEKEIEHFSYYMLASDITPPTITIKSPAVSGDYMDAKPTIEVLITDGGTGVDTSSIQMKLNGVSVVDTAKYNNSTGTLSYTPLTPLTEDSYNLEISAKDGAGNTPPLPVKSIFKVKQAFEITNLLAGPSPFNANDQNQPCKFGFQLSASSTVSVTVDIYSSTKNLIRRLGPELKNVGYNEILWDGKNNAGEIVANSVYFYFFEATDAEGHKFRQKGKIVVIKQ